MEEFIEKTKDFKKEDFKGVFFSKTMGVQIFKNDLELRMYVGMSNELRYQTIGFVEDKTSAKIQEFKDSIGLNLDFDLQFVVYEKETTFLNRYTTLVEFPPMIEMNYKDWYTL